MRLLKFSGQLVERSLRLITGGLCIVKLGLRRRILGDECCLSLEFDLGTVKPCLRGINGGLRGVDFRFVGRLLDDIEQVARLDRCPFGEGLFLKVTLDAGAEIDFLQCGNPATETHGGAEVAGLRLDDSYSGGRRLRGGRVLLRCFVTASEREANNQ